VKLAAVVVWYHPFSLGGETAIQNILSYSEYFNAIIIVDNSQENNMEFAKKIPGAVYVPNLANLGIAKALNIGCDAALNHGHDWVMTMDQDSSWDRTDIQLFLHKFKNHKNDSDFVRSFGPATVHKKEIRSVLGTIKSSFLKMLRSQVGTGVEDFEFVDRIISSGNIINLQIWKAIGGFNNELFINDVDYDFCYRLIQRGYKIIKINSCKMLHVDSAPQKTFFPHAFWYHKERIYYSLRNKYFILNNYPEFAKKYRYKASIRRIIFEKIFFFEFGDLKYVFRGIFDGKKNKLGRYCYPS
jgi:rhamnosyltransferase